MTVQTKGRIRHIALSVKDPWETAEFYKQAVGLQEVMELDGPLAEGVFLSDGVVNLAILHFKNDEASQGTGVDYVGIHHRFRVDDVVERARSRATSARPDRRSQQLDGEVTQRPQRHHLRHRRTRPGRLAAKPGRRQRRASESAAAAGKFDERRAAYAKFAAMRGKRVPRPPSDALTKHPALSTCEMASRRSPTSKRLNDDHRPTSRRRPPLPIHLVYFFAAAEVVIYHFGRMTNVDLPPIISATTSPLFRKLSPDRDGRRPSERSPSFSCFLVSS